MDLQAEIELFSKEAHDKLDRLPGRFTGWHGLSQ